jgi:hypothetical protein
VATRSSSSSAIQYNPIILPSGWPPRSGRLQNHVV